MRRRRDASISTAKNIRNEHVPFLCVTSCRFATMRVANSRLLMLPNSEIRQNLESGNNITHMQILNILKLRI